MHRAARRSDPFLPGALRRCVRASVTAALALLMAVAAVVAPAAEAELTGFELMHDAEGVFLSYAVDLDLPRGVDEALSKAVPLFFVAEAEVFRSRFYWRDPRVGHAVRRWRIVFQPLTATYRVTFDGGLSRNYASRPEALAAISRSAGWKIAEAAQVADDSRHYVEFSYRLDTSQLPRPMQIGIGGQSDWAISVKRTQTID